MMTMFDALGGGRGGDAGGYLKVTTNLINRVTKRDNGLHLFKKIGDLNVTFFTLLVPKSKINR